MHQDDVHCETMKPGREGGLTSECGDFSKKLHKRLLREVLRLSRIIYHSQAKGIDPALMEAVKGLKGLRISIDTT
jgi:hypothetical protein